MFQAVCLYCSQPTKGGMRSSVGMISLCSTCMQSELPCTRCRTMTPAYMLSMPDTRFPIWEAVLTLCEECKGIYFLQHRDELREQYCVWLEQHYPTPCHF